MSNEPLEQDARQTAAKLSDLLDEGKELDALSHELVRTAVFLLLAVGTLVFVVWRYF